VKEVEDEARELNNLETLFDMQKSTYKQLKDCSNELVSLKQMWDLIALIDYQFDTWKETLWAKIKTDDLLQQVEKMKTGQCNVQAPQNKEIKGFRSFLALVDRVKNMTTILPLVSLLNSKDILDRHWKKLMVTTNQTIDFKSPKFCLDDLIKLELHKFAEEV
jgi:dynein heavy chain